MKTKLPIQDTPLIQKPELIEQVYAATQRLLLRLVKEQKHLKKQSKSNCKKCVR